MIRIYLASFLQPNNFGPSGRIIGIVNPVSEKPKNVRVSGIFEPLTPKLEFIAQYNKLRPTDPISAGKLFVESYKKQLDDFLKVLEEQKENEITDLLPFEDGDTLASWERAEFTNYRKILAPYLQKIGYEVVLN
jgi:hypothetical protein